jgi:hypothetical protein
MATKRKWTPEWLENKPAVKWLLVIALISGACKGIWEAGGEHVYDTMLDIVENQRTFKKRNAQIDSVMTVVTPLVKEFASAEKTVTTVIREHDSLINWNRNAIDYLHNNQIVITSMLAGELDDVPIMHKGVWRHLKQSNYGDYFYLRESDGEWFSAQFSGAYNKYYYVDFEGVSHFCWEEAEE